METKLIRIALAEDEQPAWTSGREASGLGIYFRALNYSRVLVILLLLVAVAASVAVAYLLPPYWRADIVVMPVNRNDPASLGSITPALSSLGSIIARQDPLKDEALAVLRSRELFDTYAKDKNLLPILFEDRWDPATNTWKVPPERVPTLRQGYRLFNGRIRAIDEDRRTGIVTLSITWTDRQLAATWARDMIDLANKQLRDRALQDSQRNMKYLTDEIRASNQASAQLAVMNSLASAYDKQLQIYMFAKGQDEYAFRVIDQPTVPDARERVSPRRTLIVGAGFMIGLFFASLLAYARFPAEKLRAAGTRQLAAPAHLSTQ
jgi:uncharacterized protein involved in exopolysaccharide biosynthesis